MEIQPASQNQKPSINWFSAGQFALSTLAVFGLWGGAILMAVVGLVEVLRAVTPPEQALSLLMLSAGLASAGFLLLPSAIYCFLDMIGRPGSSRGIAWPGFLRPSLLIFVLPLVLLIGYAASLRFELALLILPPLHVLAVGLPVYWLLFLGQRDLPLGSAQLKWGIFGSGLVLGPALILVAELAAILLFVMLGVVIIAAQPGLADEMMRLVEQLSTLRTSPEAMAEVLGPYLAQPVVILAVLSFGSVIVPLIEESLKPIGVWFLVGRNLSAAQGFAAGVLSGAGYAMFESLALGNSGESWVYLVVARIGTAIIHILTAGLTGWALALAWQRRRYLRLGLTFLLAVLIHGAWNGLTLIIAFSDYLKAQGSLAEASFLSRLSSVAPFGLGALTIGGFAFLLYANRALRPAQLTPVPQPVSAAINPNLTE